MPRGHHYGRSQTRSYTTQYCSVPAKVFKQLLTAPVGHYNLSRNLLSDEHNALELTESESGNRSLTFVIAGKPHYIALQQDNRSVSNKLYITCPYCRKQRQKLFAIKTAYACRECLNLSYLCQSKGKQERLARRIRKLRNELWGVDYPQINNLFENILLWPKPKWTRWRTFECKREKILALEARYWPIAITQIDNLYNKCSINQTD